MKYSIALLLLLATVDSVAARSNKADDATRRLVERKAKHDIWERRRREERDAFERNLGHRKHDGGRGNVVEATTPADDLEELLPDVSDGAGTMETRKRGGDRVRGASPWSGGGNRHGNGKTPGSNGGRNKPGGRGGNKDNRGKPDGRNDGPNRRPNRGQNNSGSRASDKPNRGNKRSTHKPARGNNRGPDKPGNRGNKRPNNDKPNPGNNRGVKNRGQNAQNKPDRGNKRPDNKPGSRGNGGANSNKHGHRGRGKNDRMQNRQGALDMMPRWTIVNPSPEEPLHDPLHDYEAMQEQYDAETNVPDPPLYSPGHEENKPNRGQRHPGRGRNDPDRRRNGGKADKMTTTERGQRAPHNNNGGKAMKMAEGHGNMQYNAERMGGKARKF